jgi:hypothetical protein
VDTETKQKTRERRRSGRRASDQRTAYEIFRWHIQVGSWVGHALFLVIGTQFAWYLGGYGGAKFFEVLFLMDLTGPFAAVTGMVIGVIVGTLSIWGILVVVCSALGAFTYWIKYRSFPAPTA